MMLFSKQFSFDHTDLPLEVDVDLHNTHVCVYILNTTFNILYLRCYNKEYFHHL